MYSESDDAEESIGNKYLSRRRSDGPLINTESVGFKRYKNLDEMDKDLKEALRVNKILNYRYLFSLYVSLFNFSNCINYFSEMFSGILAECPKKADWIQAKLSNLKKNS